MTREQFAAEMWALGKIEAATRELGIVPRLNLDESSLDDFWFGTIVEAMEAHGAKLPRNE